MFAFLAISVQFFSHGIQLDTVRALHVVTIGERAPKTPFLLGEISGIALDDSNRIYVTDFQDPRILVFDQEGRHLATIGRRGRGPGEFIAPTGPVFGPDGALYVRNSEQVLRFIRDTRTGLPTAFDRAFQGPSMAPWRSKLSSVIDRARRFHFPVEAGLRDGLTHYAYWRYRLTGERLDSLPVPLYPTSRSSWASIPGGRIVPGLNVVPFHANPAWAVSMSGTLVSGPADRYELHDTDSLGRSLRLITRSVPPVRIARRERAESLRALRRRIDSLPLPVSEVRLASEEVRAQRLPTTYPAYRQVLLTPSGELWVQRWTPPALRGATILDVFDAGGVYRQTILLPVDCALLPPIAVRGRTVACVQVDPTSGAESIVVARLP